MKKLLILVLIFVGGFALGRVDYNSFSKKANKVFKEFNLMSRAKKLQSLVEKKKKSPPQAKTVSKTAPKKVAPWIYANNEKKFDSMTNARCLILEKKKNNMELFCQGNLKQQRKIQKQIAENRRGN